MARTAATFKQADLVRAVKAARSCGLDVLRTEISADGRIVLVHHNDSSPADLSPFDEWKAMKNARAAEGYK